jgi:predicted dehydrogenase
MLRKFILSALFFALAITPGCADSQRSERTEATNGNKVTLITLDPGHYHAALVQKSMYEQINPLVYVYAPKGPDVESHLEQIDRFNRRQENPTSWRQEVYTGDDFLEKMIEEKPGDIAILSGNNRRKAEYIKASIDAGLNVFCDKPMCIDARGFKLLQQAFATADKKGLLLYDIMTERYNAACILQKLLVLEKDLFGEMETGTPENPAVVKESVHHFFKYVAGAPLKRPAWYFDTTQQGEGLVDVTTHLIDLMMWTFFPEQAIDHRRDIVISNARRWATTLTKEQYKKVTGVSDFPAYLKDELNEEGALPCYANGETTFKIKGVWMKLSVTWNFQAPEGGADTHTSLFRGSKSHVIIRQGKEQDYRPEVYVEPTSGASAVKVQGSLKRAIARLQKEFPGLRMEVAGDGWHMAIPDKCRIGHEAHFRKVMEKYLQYLAKGRLPDWEAPNMLAKYYITTKSLELARQ